MDNVIEKCVREKARFPFRGQNNSIEDMFDLNTEQLKGVFNTLAAQQRGNVETLFGEDNPEDATLRMKLDALRYIGNLKVAEAQAAETALIKEQTKRRYQKALRRKEEDKIKNMPEEEIEQLLESL